MIAFIRPRGYVRHFADELLLCSGQFFRRDVRKVCCGEILPNCFLNHCIHRSALL